jgi:Aspartyl protease
VPETPFEYIHHLVTVPVIVGGSRRARFVLDTGIGLTLLSTSLADALACEADGSRFTGKRMSGQEMTVPLAPAPPLALGTFATDEKVVGILDMSGFPEALQGIDGFLSLAFFEHAAFTVDYRRRVVVVETDDSLVTRESAGTQVAVRVERDPPAVTAFLPMTVPGRARIEVEVDMGSDSLILDESLARDVGVDLDDPSVRRVEGTDETGNPYTRSFTRLRGVVHPADASALVQRDPAVMFQHIVYDGLVGDAFLRNHIVTYDLSRSRMIFG